ncbi:conjugative transposon protein TraM [Mucilaginibacter gynuensis]|uniref:Conjugative transposon protein TraM n=1 Tax=Mucilaginibacter gynuensis TaxID=1302236 RepID=A0ABP8HJ93_9SPHI
MKIDIKQPKYVLPVLLLPFICFFFYLWQTEFSKPEQVVKEQKGLNPAVGEVSEDIRKKDMATKLDAFRDAYKEASGTSAVSAIPKESSSNPEYHDPYSKREKDQRMLDSISKLAGSINQHATRSRSVPEVDRAIADLYNQRRPAAAVNASPPEQKAPDPMEIFKQQVSYMDSISKENDPEYREEKLRRAASATAMAAKATALKVRRAVGSAAGFHTIMPVSTGAFISAVIDENITGYGGSRLRLKLMEDIKAGDQVIKKGTYLYALISGFSEQRVTLNISTILSQDKILPVNLQVYDLDGLPGLYVPSSAFRDFTKDLGGNTMQGININGSSGNSQFIMSTVDKVFQSTSSAIASLLRKNKAKLKYNSYIYLIDAEALQGTQR